MTKVELTVVARVLDFRVALTSESSSLSVLNTNLTRVFNHLANR